MSARFFGERRVAERIVDGGQALGDLILQGQILAQSDSDAAPAYADSLGTTGLAVTLATSPKGIDAGSVRWDLAGGALRGSLGLIAASGDLVAAQRLRSGTVGAQTITAAGDTVGSTSFGLELTTDGLGPYTLTSTPSIAAPTTTTALHVMFVTNVHATDSITIQDESALAGTQVRGLGGANIVLSAGARAMLIWVPTAAEWWQV